MIDERGLSKGASPTLLGARVTRREDPRFVSGHGRYIDDLTPPDCLHLRLVRSQHANARIDNIRIGGFEAPPTDTAFFTALDTGDLGISSDVRGEGWQNSFQPVLAKGRVRYVGEPVAAVLHADPYVAEDAAETVVIDYEPLRPLIDIGSGLASDEAPLHDGWTSNLFVRRRRSYGDVASARERAAHVVRWVSRTHRQAGVPLEGRGCIAEPNTDGSRITLRSSTQVPHLVRTLIAAELALPEHTVRVVAPDVGGGFGVKGHVFGEELLVCWLALQLGRPVKWIEDRSEHLQASIHARDHLHLVEAYVDEAGCILGIRAQLVVDAGAYSVYPWTAGSDSGMAAKVLPGPYDIQDYEVEDIAVATHKCPLGTYRGVGRPSSVFTMEGLMDEIARRLKLDPADIRRRNLIKKFPYTTAVGLEYDPGSYLESLEEALRLVGYEGLRARTREQIGRMRTGVGLAIYNEQTAHGTPDFEIRKTPIETGYESVAIDMAADGTVTVNTGLQSHGQSMETTLAQVVAHELGISLGAVRVLHGDSGASPYSVGTWGSRGAVLGGGAAARAARQIKEKLLAIAAHRLETDPSDLVMADGRVSLKGAKHVSVAIEELAYTANRHTALLPPGLSPGLQVSVFLDGPARGTFSNACHAVVVHVDVITGRVHIDRYIVVEDCGVMINPTVVEGQVHGGVAQGIGSALLEESLYSEEGQPLSSTLMDYLLPTATDVPQVEVHHICTASPWTEHGIKGMGEAGAIGPMAAIANAIGDALDGSICETPLRPERVWRAVRNETDVERLWTTWAKHPTLEEFWRGDDQR